jgi:hypothetical protein
MNNLTGKREITVRVFGTSAARGPTGTITFTPPSGQKLNGGAVDANVTFSGFTQPAMFSLIWLTTLGWFVAPSSLIQMSKLSSQSDSVAADVATLKTDFNALLGKLRTAGLM